MYDNYVRMLCRTGTLIECHGGLKGSIKGANTFSLELIVVYTLVLFCYLMCLIFDVGILRSLKYCFTKISLEITA